MKTKHHILIVDDDLDDREIVRDAFLKTMAEHEYVFLENGDRLLEYLDTHAADHFPSLILLDLNMPGKDGRETLKEIKSNKRYQPIPTIIFTTSASQRDRAIAYGLGANCFITKPDTFNKLVDLTQCIAQLWLQ
ncbi:MAG TPA: response regulator [Flavisolibacter sp.]|nr:response regulator [Flavisolibacter sp.]